MNQYQKEVPYADVVSVETQTPELQERYCRAVVHPRDRAGTGKPKAASTILSSSKPKFVLCRAQASWYVYVDDAQDMRVAICGRHKPIAEKGKLKVKTSR